MKIGKFIRSLLGIESRIENLRIRQKTLEVCLRQSYDLHLADKEDPAMVEPTIVPRLSGGLGNQMFQIAAAYALARRVGSKLALNYDKHFNTGQGNHPLKYKDTLYRKIPITDQWPASVYHYHEYIYWPVLPVRHLQLDGFFQSGKYFSDCQNEIRDLFEFPEQTLTEARLHLGADKRQTVGIHIRLGDYLEDRYKNSLRVCTPHYYRAALRHFPRDKYRFILCSDDPGAAEDLLRGAKVEVFRGSDDLAEMALLSQCNNLIISNSSFSWWSCFLGIKKETVIAPSHWFAEKKRQIDADMYEPDWIKTSTARAFPFL